MNVCHMQYTVNSVSHMYVIDESSPIIPAEHEIRASSTMEEGPEGSAWAPPGAQPPLGLPAALKVCTSSVPSLGPGSVVTPASEGGLGHSQEGTLPSDGAFPTATPCGGRGDGGGREL